MNFIDNFKNLDIELHGVRLPEIRIEKEKFDEYGLDGKSNYEFLRALALNGFEKLKLKKGSEEYKIYSERAKKELSIFQELGFVDYLLLVWQVINFCKENEIETGAGRGSACGSLILFLIGVTRIDPIKHKLYFERFISKTRAKKTVVDGITYLDGGLMVDVDLDIDYFKRDKVIKFLEERYPNRTCKTATFNTLSGKLLIKECGKIVSCIKESEMTRVAGLLPKIFGSVRDIQETYEGIKDKDGNEKEPPVSEFVEWVNSNKRVYEIALKLRDLIKNKSVHPSAILVSHDNIDESIPTEKTKTDELCCSYDMGSASICNVKLDVLGLRCVSVVDETCKIIGLNPNTIDYNDEFIYQVLQNFRNPHGVFQLEADCNYEVTRKVKPRNIEELSAVLALARPGALSFVDNYSKYTNHNQIELPDIESDKLKSILSETGGCLLFQETLMRIGHEVFEIDLDTVELLRRATGKKKKDEMAKYESLIKELGAKLNIPKSAEFYWKTLLASADYSFNLSHAAAYASLSASTIYLKYKYPKEFFLVLLRMTKEEPNPMEEINKIEKEMKHFGIKLLPPHITKSEIDFSIQGNDIRFGLSSIKGISERTIEKLDSFRHQHKSKFELFEASRIAKLPINVLVSLIQVGALEEYPQSRSWITLEAQTWNILNKKEKEAAMMLGKEFEENLIKIIPELTKRNNEKGKPYIKESRFETIKKKYNPYKLIYQQNSKAEDFAKWFYEMKLLGYSYGKRLLDIYRAKKPDLIGIEEVIVCGERESVCFVGQIIEIQKGVTRAKKADYVRCVVADEISTVSVFLFNDKITQSEELNGGQSLKEDDFVIVRGQKKGEDSVFAEIIAIQSNEIYMKLSQIKDSEFENDDMKDFEPKVFVKKQPKEEDFY